MFQYPQLPPTTLLKTSALIALILLICGSSNVKLVSGQDSIPEDTLQLLKDATVFVRVEMGEESGSGSGFLIGSLQDYGYIVTNEHVVRQRGPRQRTIEVDFYSGTTKRKSLSATVMSEDGSRDLAVLRVRNIDLPKPIKLKSATKIRETLGVYILGFPFGEALSTNRLGPNVTIGKGTISSIRSDDFGNLQEVQVDGDINPGNSGGPIVFADGSLMGVSVKTVLGTQIGIGIPGESVSEMLFGRIGSLRLSQESTQQKQVSCFVNAKLIDPLEKIKNVSFLYIEADRITPSELKPEKDGSWSKISSKMKSVNLGIEGQTASGQFLTRGEHGEKVSIMFQIKVVNGRNQPIYTSPDTYELLIPKREDGKPKPSNHDDIASNDSMDGTTLDPPEEDGSDWLGSDSETEGETAEGTDEEGEHEDGWLGNEQPANAGIMALLPKETNASLIGEEFDCLDAQCIRLNLESSELISKLIWDAKSEHFFVLTEKGMLRKISFPGLVEVSSLDLGAKCKWMEMSKQGLCILVTGLQDMVIVDPATMRPTKKFAVGEAADFGTSLASTLAYVAVDERLVIYSLINGKPLRAYDPSDLSSENSRIHSFYGPKLTPDGRYLLCVSLQCITRFRVKGNSLTLEESGPSCGSNTRRLEVSDDSKYVALPAGGGNGDGYSTFVYSVKNLNQRLIAVESGAYPETIAFDKAAGVIYGQNLGTELITFTPKGLVKKSYDLLPRNSNGTSQILVHPDGCKVIVMSLPNIVVVNLPQ